MINNKVFGQSFFKKIVGVGEAHGFSHTHSAVVLLLCVNKGFQVLFHSPPGVLFTVPSQYYSLSVAR